MDENLYEILGLIGLAGSKMKNRRRLISLAWNTTSERTPYKLDQLLTYGGVFTGLRILTVIAMFGYEEATRLYPALKDGEIPPPSENVIRDSESGVDNFVPKNLEELEDFISGVENDKIQDAVMMGGDNDE